MIELRPPLDSHVKIKRVFWKVEYLKKYKIGLHKKSDKKKNYEEQ